MLINGLTLLILIVTPAANSQSRHPDAVDILSCSFGRDWDVNYDDWPDRWQRQFGPNLPHYVVARIEADGDDDARRCLVVHANGGGALVQSPCASVSPNFSYKVESRIRVTGLKYARAQIRLEFCDENKRVLQSAAGAWLSATDGWVESYVGPVNPTHPETRLARVVLQVEPGERADLDGQVALADLWVGRLPRMSVGTNSPFNVYTDRDAVEVTCDLSGILDSDPDILFELLDASSQRLQGDRVTLEGRLIDVKRSKASEIIESDRTQQAAYAGATSWRPPIRKDGFYRVRVTMETAEGRLKRDVINIAMAPPLDRPHRGEFGWSLAGDELPIGFDDLAALLPRVGVHWVKLPMWYGLNEASRGDELSALAERLAAEDIELVGVIDRPPDDLELAGGLRADSNIAETISIDPSTWLPYLDPVLTRLSLRVRWWQLGGDYDVSLSATPRLQSDLTRLRGKLFRFGQDVNLGIGWNWSQTAARTSTPAPWEFEQFSASPSLTGEELGEFLDVAGSPGVRRWILVEPLSRRDYDLQTRARDLVEQMLAGKIHGADAIFMARPFDDDRGLMTDAGAPGELLLPWRTTASLLAGAKYLGSLPLAGGSRNHLFEQPSGKVVMVVWNDQPTKERLFLGNGVQVLDVWGRAHDPKQGSGGQIIETEPLPRFIVGVNPHLAKFQMGVRFAESNVPSVFGKAHGNRLEIINGFPQGVGGVVELSAPEGWQISPARIDFKLAANESIDRPFEVTLPFDAASGAAPIRADFVVEADRPYRFSVYRELVVGDGQIELETNSYFDYDGSLIVEQRMINRGDSLVDFKCLLSAAGRRHQRSQVFRLGAGPDVKIYRYPNAADLVDAEFWLRAQEVDGPRVLNHRFMVEQ